MSRRRFERVLPSEDKKKIRLGSLIQVDKGRLPFYYGIGGRMKFSENNNDNFIGVRVPFGLAYIFETAPVDIFFELVPVLDLAPDTDFDFNAALGVRYFF